MAVNTAPVKWAQRADSIYLTLDLPDVKDEQLKLTKDMLSFRSDAKQKNTNWGVGSFVCLSPIAVRQARNTCGCLLNTVASRWSFDATVWLSAGSSVGTADAHGDENLLRFFPSF